MQLDQLIAHYSEHASECLEYKRNEDFNSRLDSGDIEGFELLFRTPSGEEQTISLISATLFVNDLPTYRQLFQADLDDRRNEVLNTDEFPENDLAYDRLLSLVRNKATVIPFVGAGFSVAAGCPSWSHYISGLATRAGLDRHEVEDRLSQGDHEALINEVIQRLSLNVFQRDFRAQFEGNRIAPSLSPSLELAELFNECYVTTNFDRVLDHCHSERHPFDEKVLGKENNGRFLKSIYRSEKYLLKLHGNIDDQENRVLTLDEYNAAYGDGEIDYSLPIPRTLRKVFSGYSTLFVGCSLIADRYLSVLRDCHDEDPEFIPDHFAILTAPDDTDERLQRDQFLASHGIIPIWFKEGDWEKPAEILKLLKSER